MTVTNFDEESNLLEITEIRTPSPRHVRRMYVLIVIIVLTALASFGLGLLTERGSPTTGAGNSAVTSGTGQDSSLNSLNVPAP